jgi:hypothetical protein
MDNMGRLLVFPENISQERYELIVAFDSDDVEFTRGFEAGRVYATLKERRETCIEFQVHGTNAVMMERIAKATGYIIDALDDEGTEEGETEWLTLRFIRRNM